MKRAVEKGHNKVNIFMYRRLMGQCINAWCKGIQASVFYGVLIWKVWRRFDCHYGMWYNSFNVHVIAIRLFFTKEKRGTFICLSNLQSGMFSKQSATYGFLMFELLSWLHQLQGSTKFVKSNLEMLCVFEKKMFIINKYILE